MLDFLRRTRPRTGPVSGGRISRQETTTNTSGFQGLDGLKGMLAGGEYNLNQATSPTDSARMRGAQSISDGSRSGLQAGRQFMARSGFGQGTGVGEANRALMQLVGLGQGSRERQGIIDQDLIRQDAINSDNLNRRIGLSQSLLQGELATNQDRRTEELFNRQVRDDDSRQDALGRLQELMTGIGLRGNTLIGGLRADRQRGQMGVEAQGIRELLRYLR